MGETFFGLNPAAAKIKSAFSEKSDYSREAKLHQKRLSP